MASAESIRVPDSDAPWYPDIVSFALSYNAYERHGGRESAYAAAKPAKKALQSGTRSPRSISMYSGQPCSYTNEGSTTSERRQQGLIAQRINRLLDAIREASGGSVPGPPDDYP